MQFVEAVAFLCLMDVGMIPFLPWKKEVSRFFELSEGFPSYPLMTYCLMINTFSTVIIVACEIYYLAVSSPTGSAESLFIINIVFGIVSVVMAALVLGLRGHILKNIDEGEGGEDKENKGGGGRGLQGQAPIAATMAPLPLSCRRTDRLMPEMLPALQTVLRR